MFQKTQSKTHHLKVTSYTMPGKNILKTVTSQRLSNEQCLFALINPGICPVSTIELKNKSEKTLNRIGISRLNSCHQVNSRWNIITPSASVGIIKKLKMISFTLNEWELDDLRHSIITIEHSNLKIARHEKVPITVFYTKNSTNINLYHYAKNSNFNEIFLIENMEKAKQEVSQENRKKLTESIFLGKARSGNAEQWVQGFEQKSSINIIKCNDFPLKKTIEWQSAIEILFDIVTKHSTGLVQNLINKHDKNCTYEVQEGPLSLTISPINGIRKIIISETQNSKKRKNSVTFKDNEQNNKRLKQARSESGKESLLIYEKINSSSSKALKENEIYPRNESYEMAESEPETEQNKKLMSTKDKIEMNNFCQEKSKTRENNIINNIKDQINEHNSSELPDENMDDSLLDVPSSDDDKGWEQEEPDTNEGLFDFYESHNQH